VPLRACVRACVLLGSKVVIRGWIQEGGDARSFGLSRRHREEHCGVCLEELLLTSVQHEVQCEESR
jgi:hypothetical protein